MPSATSIINRRPATDYRREFVKIKYATVGKSAGQTEASLVVCFEHTDPGPTQSSVHLPLSPGPISDFLDVVGVLELAHVSGCTVLAFSLPGAPHTAVGFGATGPGDGPASMFWR